MAGRDSAAEAPWDSLRGEIEAANLSELLRDARKRVLPNPKLGIEKIDAALEALKHPNQTGPPVLEVTSHASGQGKTSLLYYLAARAILPARYNNFEVSGYNAAVVFIDADHRFDAARLREVMLNFVFEQAERMDLTGSLTKFPFRDLNALNAMIYDCLEHVHVFQPTSAAEQVTMLNSLCTYLLKQRMETGAVAQHQSAARSLHSIYIDSASAFYYQDRFERQVSNYYHRDDARFFDLGASARALWRLRDVFHCAVVYTTWGLKPTGRDGSLRLTDWVTVFGPYMPPPWRNFAHCRLVVRRRPVKRFPEELRMDLLTLHDQQPLEDEQRRDLEVHAATRHDAVQLGMFDATVDWGYRIDGGGETINGPMDRRDYSFGFRVTTFGVNIDG
ncbi:hypothetical protein KEM55_007337 [Ascosphaera atra]|nr:hypothetical protein KEM55_007337 [Ascosphaera atra]